MEPWASCLLDSTICRSVSPNAARALGKCLAVLNEGKQDPPCMPFLHHMMSYAKSREICLQGGPGAAPALQAEELPGKGASQQFRVMEVFHSPARSYHTSIRQQAQATSSHMTKAPFPHSMVSPWTGSPCSALKFLPYHIPTASPPESLWQGRQPPADCVLQIHLIFHPTRGRDLAAISIPLTSPFVLHGRDFQIDLREPLPGGGSQQVGEASSLASLLFLLTSEQH